MILYIKFGILNYEELRNDRNHVKNKIVEQFLLLEDQ